MELPSDVTISMANRLKIILRLEWSFFFFYLDWASSYSSSLLTTHTCFIFILSIIYHHSFLSLSFIFEPDFKIKYKQDGEQVEFEVIEEPNGRFKAYNVTGPDGSYVQGAPKRFNDNGYGHDGSGGY